MLTRTYIKYFKFYHIKAKGRIIPETSHLHAVLRASHIYAQTNISTLLLFYLITTKVLTTEYLSGSCTALYTAYDVLCSES